MKKSIRDIIILCLILSTLIFVVLWQMEKNSKDDLRMLAHSSAYDAYTHFVEYQAEHKESDYWHAVAAFRSFEQAYYLLTEDTNKHGNYSFCNDVYGALLLFPEKCQNKMSEIVAVMGILAQDVEDENGYVKMLELRNTLEYE